MATGSSDGEPSRDRGVAAMLVALRDNSGVKQLFQAHQVAASSATASIFSTGLAYPLDSMKSRMQSYNTKFLPTLQETYHQEGFRGFWRGVGPPLLSVTIVRTISFSIYSKAKKRYAEYFKDKFGVDPIAMLKDPKAWPSVWTLTCCGLAGATAGSMVTLLSCPFELTKLQAQLSTKMKLMNESKGKVIPTTATATAVQLIRDRGLSGLYCGYRLHLLRDFIGTSIYFMVYESAKQIVGSGGAPSTTFLGVVLGGGSCGVISWSITYPLDVAKTRYQKALLCSPGKDVKIPKIEVFKRGAYRGLGVSLARSAVINSVFFVVYETLKLFGEFDEHKGERMGEHDNENNEID